MAPISLIASAVDRDDAIHYRKLLDSLPAEIADLPLENSFAELFARFVGTHGAYAFMQGREAFSACLEALGLQQGDEILIPAFTCVVVPNAIKYAGFQPVYCDIELDTYGMDLDAARKKLNSSTKAVLIQHLFGLVSRDCIAIVDLAHSMGIPVIEDCAHSIGASIDGRNVGTFGDLAFYSFEHSKSLSSVTGGVAVSCQVEFDHKLRDIHMRCPYPDRNRVVQQIRTAIYDYHLERNPLRFFLREWTEYRWGEDKVVSTTKDEIEGIRPSNYFRKMPGAICMMASRQINKANDVFKKRRRIARRWEAIARSRGWRLPVVVRESQPVFTRYPVLVPPDIKSNPKLLEREFGVQVGIWFTGSIHPVHLELPDCPNAMKAVKECINFPC